MFIGHSLDALAVRARPRTRASPRLRAGAARRRCVLADVLTIEEIDKPELFEDGVLVRVRTTALNPTDYVVV